MIFTSEEDVFEGESIENTESVWGPHSKTPLILIKTNIQDLFFRVVGGCTLHEGMGLD
jgi:hypothetical protein